MRSTPSPLAAAPLGKRPLARLIGLALIVLGLFTGLVDTAGAVRDRDNGLISDSKYESPTFGYRVEWGDAWEAEPGATRSTPAYDVLVLESWGASLEVLGVASADEPEDVLDLVRANGVPTTKIACDEIDTEWLAKWDVADRGEEDGAAYTLLYGTPAETDAGWYLEAREVEDAAGDPVVVVVSLVVPIELLADTIGYATDEIELDGFPIFLAAEEVELGKRDGGRPLGVAAARASYRSPTYGYTIDWDDDWALLTKSSDGKIDEIDIINEGTLSQLSILGFETDGEPEETVGNIAASMLEDHEEAEIVAEGEVDGAAFVTLSGAYGNDETIGVLHLEVRAIEAIDDDRSVVTLTVFWTTAADDAAAAAAANDGVELNGEPILLSADAIGTTEKDEDGDDSAARPASCDDGDEREAEDEDRDDDEEGSRGRERPDENGLIGDDAYRSPTYGFEVEWSGDWLADDARVGTSSDQLYLANADNTAQIWLTGLATDEDLDEVRDEFAIGFVSQVSEDSELLDRGRANGAYWATFEIDFGEGGMVLAYVEAREIEPAEPDEPAIVTVTIFFAVEPLFDELIADAAEHVELEGEPILISYE